MTDAASPEVRLELIDVIALPSLTRDEMSRKLSAWTIDNDCAVDIRAILQSQDFSAADLSLLEITADGAAPEDLRDAMQKQNYETTAVAQALQLLACGYFPDVQPFPIACTGAPPMPNKMVYVQKRSPDHVALFCSDDGDTARDSHHLFALAQKRRLARS